MKTELQLKDFVVEILAPSGFTVLDGATGGLYIAHSDTGHFVAAVGNIMMLHNGKARADWIIAHEYEWLSSTLNNCVADYSDSIARALRNS